MSSEETFSDGNVLLGVEASHDVVDRSKAGHGQRVVGGGESRPVIVDVAHAHRDGGAGQRLAGTVVGDRHDEELVRLDALAVQRLASRQSPAVGGARRQQVPVAKPEPEAAAESSAD